LVAAIAAGVLINTAGFLQSQAEATGEESTSQVSDGVTVISSVSTTQDADGITAAEIVLTKSAGSGPVDVSDIDATAVGPAGTASATLTVDSGETILQNSTDNATVSFDLSGGNGNVDFTDAVDGSNGLEPGEELTLTLTTPSGAQTVEVFRAPDPLTGDPVDL
jgi:flagellin FlaB